jgi:hypothetical protein
MKEFGITRIRFEVMILTPRRFGKTVSVAMFVLSMMLCLPGVRVCVFSTGKRASSGLMQEIKVSCRDVRYNDDDDDVF